MKMWVEPKENAMVCCHCVLCHSEVVVDKEGNEHMLGFCYQHSKMFMDYNCTEEDKSTCLG